MMENMSLENKIKNLENEIIKLSNELKIDPDNLEYYKRQEIRGMSVPSNYNRIIMMGYELDILKSVVNLKKGVC